MVLFFLGFTAAGLICLLIDVLGKDTSINASTLSSRLKANDAGELTEKQKLYISENFLIEAKEC